MEAVPVEELDQIARQLWTETSEWAVESAKAIRSRLIAAARDGQPAEADPPVWQPAVGDTVRLKSGGPVMTVMHLKESECHVIWFYDGVPRECDLAITCLTPAKEAQP
jgi:uncharacterized protein YodC (DUF2158 family)